jgi:hypothetical protein
MQESSFKQILTSFRKTIENFENDKLKDRNSNQLSGCVYTPQSIADFVIKNILRIHFLDFFKKDDVHTLENNGIRLDLKSFSRMINENSQLKNQFIESIKNFKILDPACGTGRFLVSAANAVLELYNIVSINLDQYESRKYIVQNIIYGTEIENEACQISKLRLIHWVLSSLDKITLSDADLQNYEPFQDIELILNDLDLQIHVHNLDFLLNSNFNSKFDFIVGNPPHIENKKIKDKAYKKKLYENFQSAYKLYDLSILFIEKSLPLLNQNGVLTFLMPNKFLAADYGVKIRKILLQNTELKQIIDLSSLPIFRGIGSYPIIISIKNAVSNDKSSFAINKFYVLDDILEKKIKYIKKFNQNALKYIPAHVVPISGNINLLEQFYMSYKTMNQLTKDLKIIYRPFGFINWNKHFNNISKNKSSENDLLLIGTGNVGKYYINFDKRIRIAKNNIAISYFNYNSDYKINWDKSSGEKLIFREIAKKMTVVYDPGIFTNITGLYFIKISSFNTNSLFSLLTILNSQLINNIFNWLFGTLSMSGNYLRFNGSFIKRLPIIDRFPDSFSYIGKYNQILAQALFDNSTTQYPKIKYFSNFFSDLGNTLVYLEYLKDFDEFFSTEYDSLNRLLERNFFDVDFKYTIKRFNIPNYETYTINEFELILKQLKKLITHLNDKRTLISKIKSKISQLIFS